MPDYVRGILGGELIPIELLVNSVKATMHYPVVEIAGVIYKSEDNIVEVPLLNGYFVEYISQETGEVVLIAFNNVALIKAINTNVITRIAEDERVFGIPF